MKPAAASKPNLDNCAGKERNREMEKINLNQTGLKLLLEELDLSNINDQLILLMAKTGIRYTEAAAVTPADLDLEKGLLNINKTWRDGSFYPVKDAASLRTIKTGSELAGQFSGLLRDKPGDMPIFGQCEMSTVNDRLKVHCKRIGIPFISVHTLRHTFYQPEHQLAL